VPTFYNPPVLDRKHAQKAIISASSSSRISHAELKRFATEHYIPVATTLRRKGIFPEDEDLSLGVFGYTGSPRAIDTILSREVEIAQRARILR